MKEHMKALRDHILMYESREQKTHMETCIDCDISLSELDKIIGNKAKGIYLETAFKIADGTKTTLDGIFGLTGGAV